MQNMPNAAHQDEVSEMLGGLLLIRKQRRLVHERASECDQAQVIEDLLHFLKLLRDFVQPEHLSSLVRSPSLVAMCASRVAVTNDGLRYRLASVLECLSVRLCHL